MAILRDLSTRTDHPLAARVVVGRAATAGLRLSDGRVSGEHATLLWTGGRWELRDLGSRNGSFVDGARVPPGEGMPVAAGSKVSFGDPSPQYELVEASAPGPVGRDLRSGQWIASRDGLLALPSHDQPEVVVYADAPGGWRLEAGEERRAVADGEVVDASGARFALSLPAAIEGTATSGVACLLDMISLEFQVSRDEEHVELTIVHRGKPIAVDRREHNYALLTLARHRLAEAELPAADQGWIDRERLMRMLAADANGLNVAIYRIRGQFAAAGVEDAVGIVEVRRNQRRIGVGVDRLRVGPLLE